jgi:hypothetical protein
MFSELATELGALGTLLGSFQNDVSISMLVSDIQALPVGAPRDDHQCISVICRRRR